MRSKIVRVKNITRLTIASDELIHRAPGNPGMGLVHGFTGAGKTTAITWLINKTRGIYVRAHAVMTPAALMRAILAELQVEPRGGTARMFDDAIEAIARDTRPIYIDEADHLVRRMSMCEALRDIHDMSTAPVILVGMAGIDKRLSHLKQFTRRILQEVRFEPLDKDDTRAVARELCEVAIAEDLLDLVHRRLHGNIGLIVVALSRIEAFARVRDLDQVALEHWGNEPLTTGTAPEGK